MNFQQTENVLQGQELESFCALLKVLSNPQRFRILALLQDGECSVGDIETALNIKQPNLSHELRKLRDCGVVSTRKQSKVVFYSLADPQTRAFIGNINVIGCQTVNNSLPQIGEAYSAKGLVDDRQVGASAECGMFPVINTAGY